MIFTAKCLWGKADPGLKRAHTSGTHTEEAQSLLLLKMKQLEKEEAAKLGEVLGHGSPTQVWLQEASSLWARALGCALDRRCSGHIDTSKELPGNLSAV